jgi:deazaflavin-dependent oxidoreductase (nitroreductase family)
MGRWFGAPVLVIETVGRRSGRRRRVPVTYFRTGDAWVVVAINGGADHAPAWWLNLVACSEATILLQGRRVPVIAREAEATERERLWRLYAAQTPAIEEFRTFTDRVIPVVVLEPLTPRPDSR